MGTNAGDAQKIRFAAAYDWNLMSQSNLFNECMFLYHLLKGTTWSIDHENQ